MAHHDEFCRILYLVSRFKGIIEISEIQIYHVGEDYVSVESLSAERRMGSADCFRRVFVLLFSTDRRGWSLLPLFLELEYPTDFPSSSSIKVDVILPPNTSLHCAHDLGEVMQTAIEALESVSRAYVHLDYSSRNP